MLKYKQLPQGPYQAQETEEKILKYWLDNKFYKPETARDILFKQERANLLTGNETKLSIINPPPNAYARPHIGNVSGYAYQDVFARRARMQGQVVAMIPGKDHAAQQAEIVYIRDVLSKKGQKKENFTREQFYNNAYKYFTEIAAIAQADEKRIGLSSDFDRDLFTLDPRIHSTVMRTFAKMWGEKMVYKGVRIVNWSPGLNSAVADIDTERKTVEATFYYIKYAFPEPEKEILNLRDNLKKSKIKIQDIENIEIQGKSKAEEKQIKLFTHHKIKIKNTNFSIWVNREQYENISEGDEMQVTGLIIPFDGSAQLIIGQKNTEFEKFIFHRANQIYGSSFIRWFSEDENVDKKDLDNLYRRGFILGTVRPETKFGDTAFAVNPADERFKKLVGKKLKLIGLNGKVEIKVISNPHVDREFGTGMVKVTPAHSPTDYEMYLTHNAEHPNDPIGYVNVIEKDGKLNHMAGVAEGMHAEHDREKIADMMRAAGLIVYEEQTESNIILCERTKTVIQPIMSSQWFIDTDKLKIPALKAIKNNDVVIHPTNMTKKLQFWLENLRDWPISRSIWWGYRIPVWYKGEFKEYTDVNGQVALEIGGEKVKDMQDAVEKELMKLDLNSGFAPILIPGKYAFASPTIYKELKLKYPWAQIVNVENIDEPKFTDYEEAFKKLKLNSESVVIAHSIGCIAILDFLIKNKIKIKKLILMGPSTEASERYKYFLKVGFWSEKNKYQENLPDIAEKTFVIYSPDDENQTPEGQQKLIKLLGCEAVEEKNKYHYAGLKYANNSEALEKILNEEAKTFEEEQKAIQEEMTQAGWVQDEDVFDTWFSSGQWPFATLESEGLMNFYPTSVMETGYDILELWVSRMIMLGLYTQGKVPFKNVYLHGLIKGEDGQKMSKSRGNLLYPDALIAEYGADALRMMYIVGNKAGAGYRIDREKLKGYRNFLNKIWNASRFILNNIEQTNEQQQEKISDSFNKIDLNNIDEKIPTLGSFLNESKINLTRKISELETEIENKNGMRLVDLMMLKSLKEIIDTTNSHMDAFRVGLAAEEIYQHFWHVFADIYIEQVKESLFQADREGNAINQDEQAQSIRNNSVAVLTYCLQTYLKLLHPFIPFITETLWQSMPEETRESESIMFGAWN